MTASTRTGLWRKGLAAGLVVVAVLGLWLLNLLWWQPRVVALRLAREAEALVAPHPLWVPEGWARPHPFGACVALLGPFLPPPGVEGGPWLSGWLECASSRELGQDDSVGPLSDRTGARGGLARTLEQGVTLLVAEVHRKVAAGQGDEALDDCLRGFLMLRDTLALQGIDGMMPSLTQGRVLAPVCVETIVPAATPARARRFANELRALAANYPSTDHTLRIDWVESSLARFGDLLPQGEVERLPGSPVLLVASARATGGLPPIVSVLGLGRSGFATFRLQVGRRLALGPLHRAQAELLDALAEVPRNLARVKRAEAAASLPWLPRFFFEPFNAQWPMYVDHQEDLRRFHDFVADAVEVALGDRPPVSTPASKVTRTGEGVSLTPPSGEMGGLVMTVHPP